MPKHYDMKTYKRVEIKIPGILNLETVQGQLHNANPLCQVKKPSVFTG
jgi:hypothetical protein